MRHLLLQFLLLSSVLSLASGCGSRTVKETLDDKRYAGKAHPAAYGSDSFMLDHRSPEPREFRKWEFYYKQCELVSRNPYPSQTEYSCSDPF